MKKIIMAISLLLICFQSFGQNDPSKKEEVFESFDRSNLCVFKDGGEEGLIKFIAKNTKYPKIAIENGIQGIINLVFVVDTVGNISEIKVVGKELGFGLEEEAIRVIKMTSGKWTPGKQRGVAVPVRYHIPYKFNIKETPKNKINSQLFLVPSIDSILNKEVFEIFDVEKISEFKGGEDSLLAFIVSHSLYPLRALENNISGTVILSIIISVEGLIYDIEPISDIGFGLEEEAIRVIQMTQGLWNPAFQGDKPVAMRLRLPIKFEFEELPKNSLRSPGIKQNDFYENEEVFDLNDDVDLLPHFKYGGEPGLINFIEKHLVYPEKAELNFIQGVINVEFVVDKVGIVSDITTKGKKWGYGLEKEAIRVIELTSGLWNPAMIDDEKVNFRINFAIGFNLR